MMLKPNFELLDKIGLLSDFGKFKGYKLEIDQVDFYSLEEFFKRQKSENVMHELFFYQLNYIQKFKDETENFIKNEKSFFEMIDQLQKVDFSKLQRIQLEFSDRVNEHGEKISLHPDWVNLIRGIIRSEFESEIENRKITAKGKIKELNNIQKIDSTTRLKIQKAQPDIFKIIQAKNPEATKASSFLCAYALFFQKGYRLKFRSSINAEEETNPMKLDSFDFETILNNLKRKIDI